MQPTGEERDSALAAAECAAQNAYAPYSHFRVGAAVLSEGGIHTGTNVENASYGLTLCAERAALAAMISAGDRRPRVVAVACIDAPTDGDPASMLPCGACRQWLCELAPDAEIIVLGHATVYTARELLPVAFRLQP